VAVATRRRGSPFAATIDLASSAVDVVFPQLGFIEADTLKRPPDMTKASPPGSCLTSFGSIRGNSCSRVVLRGVSGGLVLNRMLEITPGWWVGSVIAWTCRHTHGTVETSFGVGGLVTSKTLIYEVHEDDVASPTSPFGRS
jgi:hypothetical protein